MVLYLLMDINNYIELIKKEIVSDFKEPFYSDDLTSFLTSGSKMIRSNFVILYLKALGYELNEAIIKTIAVGEIIHNASLLHDDILDNAKTRRNNITIGEKFSNKISILAGDYLLTYAIKKMLEIENPQVIELYRRCTEKMIIAEIEQFKLRAKQTSIEQYLEICEGKTAQLFATMLKSCSVLLGFDKKFANDLGLKFGTIFQIKNDLEQLSAEQDKANKIQTAIDILGVEKTKDLLDNYRREIMLLLESIPNNDYKVRLEGLINNYV